jgi:hypothetical protein
MARPGLTLSAAVITLGLTGCGIADPYSAAKPGLTSSSTSASTTTTVPADAGDPAAERGGAVPPAAGRDQSELAADAAMATPRAALERYARLYLNWTAAGLVTRERQLAGISIGPARAQALQAAASAARDPELTRSDVTNTGQVIALTPGTGAAAGQWVLVSRETTTGSGDYAGLPAAVHVTYAQVTHTPGGWAVSQWSTQS